MKLWSFNRIRSALSNIENEQAYYAGGSLCIDFEDYPSVILNKNGRGFFYNFKKSSHKQINFVMPNDIHGSVMDIYTKYKNN